MVKVLANDGIDKSAQQRLEAAGISVTSTNIPQEQLATRINEFDVLTVRSATKVRKPLIDAITKTKLIVRAGVGLDNIDVEYAQQKGITVKNTPLASSQSVAELVFAHLFTGGRFLHQTNRAMPQTGYDKFNDLKKAYSAGIELRGKTLGVIGFGNIGKATARIGLGLGMNIIAHDPFPVLNELTLELFDKQRLHVKVPLMPKEELLRQADFVSVHAAGSKPVIGAEEFANMKRGAMLINCARGGVVDENALVEALNNGTISFAGIDVFENEPTPRKDLLEHPKVSLTPHIGASTNEAQLRIGEEVADIVLNFFKS